MPEPTAGESAALTAAQFAEFKARKEAERAAAAATAAAGAAAAQGTLSGRALWDACPWVFDVDEEGRPSAEALAAQAAAQASVQPGR
jgi:hypothetical protein